MDVWKVYVSLYGVKLYVYLVKVWKLGEHANEKYSYMKINIMVTLKWKKKQHFL